MTKITTGALRRETRRGRFHGCIKLASAKVTLAASIFFLAQSFAFARYKPEVWFGANDPWIREWKHTGENDYMDLFSGDGAWARHIDVLTLSMQFVLSGKEEQLKTVISFVNTRKIKVAMSGLMLNKHDGCGDFVEGYSGPNGVERAAERFKNFGGKLSYIEMDEPLYYGAVFDGKNACHSSVEDIASEVAAHVKRLQAIFPDIKVGDSEVVGSPDRVHWLSLLESWFNAYKSATGEHLAFLHSDIAWQTPRWPRQLKEMAALSEASGVRFGVFYTGNPRDTDDATWTQNALQRAFQIEERLNIHPDDPIINSWMPHPMAMLPPSDPSSLTGLLRCYLEVSGLARKQGEKCPQINF